MKKVRYLNIFIILTIYILVSIFLERLIPRVFNLGINPLFLIFISVYLYIKTNNNHGRFIKNKEYIKKMIIISLIYVILYVYLGFIFGFVRSPYSHNILTIFKNIWQIIIPIVAIEYTRSALVNNNFKNKFYIIISILMFFALELGINSLMNNITEREAAFKYISSIFMPLLFSEVIYTYLSVKGSYKLVLMYRLIIEFMFLLSPIYPDLDWFLTGILGILIPVIIYIVFKYDFDKKKRDTSRIRQKKQNPVIYVPIILLIITFVSFMAGLFIYEPIAIISNSMHPVFNRGDVVVLRKADKNELKKIDKYTIIVYSIDSQQIVHRVIDKKVENGKLVFQTMGDANNAPDSRLVNEEQVIGVYQFSIKYIGYPSVWLSEFFKNEEAKVEIK